MPDEVVEGKEEEAKEDNWKADEKVELTPVEQLAVEIGWNPNHKSGDREFVSADDYIRRSKDIQSTQTKQNKGLKRQVEDLQVGLNMIQQHNDTVYKVQVKALKSRVRELQGRRREALEDNDAEAVSAIDSQIKEIDDIPNELPVKQITTTPPEFEEWVEKNKWYTQSDEMRAYADAQGTNNPEINGLPFGKLLNEVGKLVKSKFPEEFDAPIAPRIAAVEPAGTRRKAAGAKSKYTYSDLSKSQQNICDHLVKIGLKTEEEYIKDLELIEKNQGRV